jgi:hypothetical protein
MGPFLKKKCSIFPSLDGQGLFPIFSKGIGYAQDKIPAGLFHGVRIRPPQISFVE